MPCHVVIHLVHVPVNQKQYLRLFCISKLFQEVPPVSLTLRPAETTPVYQETNRVIDPLQFSPVYLSPDGQEVFEWKFSDSACRR